MTTIMGMSMIISIMFMTMNHPLSMGMWLILQTLTITMTIGLLINMFWFSYILIITMLSGAFIYMASVASNEKFSSPMITSSLTIMTTIMS